MVKLKLGLVIGFVAGWAVGSGRAADLVKRMRATAGIEAPGSVASRVPGPTFDRTGESTPVSA